MQDVHQAASRHGRLQGGSRESERVGRHGTSCAQLTRSRKVVFSVDETVRVTAGTLSETVSLFLGWELLALVAAVAATAVA